MIGASGPCCQIINLSSNGKANDDRQLVKTKFGFYKLTNLTKHGRSVYERLDKKSDVLFYENKTGIWMVSIEFQILSDEQILETKYTIHENTSYLTPLF